MRSVNRLRVAALASIVVAMLLFGVVADRALVEQAAIADRTAHADLAEKSRLVGLSVRATISQLEEAVLAGTPNPAITTCRIATEVRVDTSAGNRAYAKRDRRELESLLSARTLTGNGLPDAVVAAIALDDPASRRRVADRLLDGVLPVSPADLHLLKDALGVATDPRVDRLMACVQRAPGGGHLPNSPDFSRRLTQAGALEAWSLTENGPVVYEIGAGGLLRLAGVTGTTVAPSVDGLTTDGVVSVPDVTGLTLLVTPERSVQLRIRMLRVALWIAIATSVLGLVAILRGVAREARAVRKERIFLANVTHELRTPLSAIRVFGETLADGRGDAREYGALVAQECQRLEGLVEHVLTIARVDEVPAFTKVKPDEIIASAIQLVASRAALRSIQINWNAESRLGGDVHWDGPAVRRALLNLLDNAVKHGKAGGRIDVSAVLEGDQVRLSVADDGPGIRRRDRKRIFGRFERGTTDGPGTGLGLYAVEHVARAHGGRVELLTREDHGCTFIIVLPVNPRERGVSGPSLEVVAVDAGN